MDYTHHCQLEFGDYIQTHEEHNNSMQLRTVGALALCPTGNLYFFFSLVTGKVLNQNHWTLLPMPNEVFDQFMCMAQQEQAGGPLLFEDMMMNHGLLMTILSWMMTMMMEMMMTVMIMMMKVATLTQQKIYSRMSSKTMTWLGTHASINLQPGAC